MVDFGCKGTDFYWVLQVFYRLFASIFILLIPYFTSTLPLLIMFQNRGSTIQNRDSLFQNKGTLFTNKRSLLFNNCHLLVTKCHLSPLYLFPQWEYNIPRLGMFCSQRGNNSVPTDCLVDDL